MDSTQSSQNQVSFVLVPGAWCGGWAWHPVAGLLRAWGHDPLPVTLPGLSYGESPAGWGLEQAVERVVHEIEERSLDEVVLVAHSWGGYPVTGAAHRVADRIKHVVYYNAVVPEAGASMADENQTYAAATRQAIAADPDGAMGLPFEAVAGVLMPDASPDLQAAIAGMTMRQPGAYMTESLDVGPVTEAGLSASYILGQDDDRGGLARPGQEFADRLGVGPVMVPGGHMGLITHPDAVARALVAIAG